MCKKKGKPTLFCFPEISAYITANARIHLYDKIIESKPYYVDTDSVFTEKIMSTGDELGELKLEFTADRCCFIKPKFYAYENDEKSKGKCKGIHLKMDYLSIIDLATVKEINYTKFAKFKESMRIKDETKKRYVNEIIKVHKDINTEDNKRKWTHLFNFEYEESVPIILE